MYVCVYYYQQAAQQSVCSSSMFSVFTEAVSLAGRLAIASEKQEESKIYTETGKDSKKDRYKRDKEKGKCRPHIDTVLQKRNLFEIGSKHLIWVQLRDVISSPRCKLHNQTRLSCGGYI